MRKVTYGAAASLDGYIAGEGDRVDWLLWTDEVASITQAYWQTIDTVLVGRKTYEVGLRSGTASYPGKQTYVFSRSVEIEPVDGVKQVAGDVVKFVSDLKNGDGAGICVMGGGELARSLFEGDLIDEVGINIHPVLLGSGIPMFIPISAQKNLELIECKKLKNSCIYLLYRVTR
ncbi:MAG: dihydrofolate reductase family protein [Acidobacteriota bacterium]